LTAVLLLSVSAMSAQKEESEDKGSSFETMMLPYVQHALEAAKNGAQFVFEEAPDVIRQYVMFEAVRRWAGVITGLLLILFGIVFIPNMVTYKKKPEDSQYKKVMGRWLRGNDYDVMLDEVIYYVAIFAGGILGFILFCIHIMPAIKVTFFPKLYLVETFIHLIK